jgi:amino acid adenylation domain-containing protein
MQIKGALAYQGNQMTTGNTSPYQLSHMQQGMLFHTLESKEPGGDIEQMICTLHETLKISAFRQAWQRVVERHSILRTSFCWEELAVPLQTVDLHVQLPWEQQDWRHLSASEQEDKLNAYLQADRQRGFELTKAPLMRLALFQLAETHYKVIWTFHHILLDGRSFLILLKEVFAFYEAFCQGEDLQLEQPRPYRDYIEWLQQQDLANAEAFWRQTLRDFTASTPLVVERAVRGGHSQESGHGEEEIQLSEAVTSALKSLAQEHELTLNILVNGAWALLLSRYSGEEDVVFGATRACRRSALEGAESMVGLFINTLPLRVRVSPDLSLLSWLKELRSQWIALRDYEHTPLMKVQKWSDIPPGRSLFESLVVFENYQLTSALQVQGGSWENRQFQLLEQTSFPLTVSGYGGLQLLLKIEYDRQRFEQATITRMLGHLQTLLEGMVANPDQCLADLPMLTAAERHQLLIEWNQTQTDYPKDKCIHHLFEAQVEQTPDAVAVVIEDQQLTYRELNSRANQLAHYLQGLGVEPEVLVAICIKRSLEMVVGLLGILKAGGAYVPLDPAYPKERLRYMLSDSQVPILLTQEQLVSELPEDKARVVALDRDWEVIATQTQENPVTEVKASNLAYIIYTSGSTGKPKGVMIEHQSVVNLTATMRVEYGMVSSDRVLQFSSLSFDSATDEIYNCLTAGGTLVLRTDEMLSSVSTFVQKCREWKLTVLELPTAYWHQIISELATTGESLPTSVRLVSFGGEAALPEKLRLWQRCVNDWRRYHQMGEPPLLINGYGPTEATVEATIYKLSESVLEDTRSQVPIGRPIGNVQAYILDRYLQPVPIGVPGELHIGGDGLARGYLNRPELTAEKFIPNPFNDEPGTRLYKTGDLVRYLPDGNIEYLGRIDNQVKIRGFRIELGEIETVLGQHPAVRETLLLVREDIPGDKRLVAYLIPKEEPAATTNELRHFLREKLPSYMIPSAFVMLETIPLTPNGKVDYRALPAPDKAQLELEERFVAPRTPVEEELAAIWTNVLGLEQIGVHNNFFDLGGHSLLAIQAISRLRQAFQVELSVRSLFESPTVAQLAELIEITRWTAQALQAPSSVMGDDYEEISL